MSNQQIELQFITHACVLLIAGEVRLLCDPWLSGTAFDDGWRLLAEPSTTIEDCSPTHIWISHEHPDHFSPRDLLKLPAEQRGHITVLYQETKDQKVESFLRAKGFRVQILPTMERVDLSPDVSVCCAPIGSDSWLAFFAYGQTVLNLNDCITGQDILIDDPDNLPSNQVDEIRTMVENPDVLLTQFSYSNWVGNPDDLHLHRLQARTKLNQVRQQIRTLKPRTVLPFASFVHFCHKENAYLNEEANTVHRVVPVIEDEDAQALVLSPGDLWRVGDSHENKEALQRWTQIYRQAADRSLEESAIVSEVDLRDAFSGYQQRVRERNDWAAIERLTHAGGLRPTKIYLWDHGTGFLFDLVNHLAPCSMDADDADICMSSSTLAYLLNYDWGRGTLMVNGRFSADYQGIHRFLAQTQIAYGNNVGLRFPETLPESIIRESPSYVAFFARQALRLNAEMG